MKRLRACLAASLLLLPTLPRAAQAALVAPSAVPGSLVRTLAGNGIAGIRDGRAADAEFLFPEALAYDARSGSTYVADSAAQRIRRISAGGMVTTLAGSGALLPGGLAVAGGYAEGGALTARFNHPSGVAVGADGSVYVADAFNHCVRVISGGVVRTFAGSPRFAQAHDGPLAQAVFREPRALAFGPEGALYVSDEGVGIRVIRNGNVSTVPISTAYDAFAKAATSISLSDHMLFVASRLGVLRFNIAAPREEPVHFGSFATYGALALDDTKWIVSSLAGSLRFFSLFRFWRAVSGDQSADVSAGAGFADGEPEAARFNTPMGLALDGRRNILVADAGNRSVRLIPTVNERWADAPPPGFDPTKAYRIAFISNSFAYYNSMWDDSIAGTIERRLNADRERLGLPKPVKVEALHLGSSLAAHGQYISSVLAAGSADLVIWSLNTNMFGAGLDMWPFVEADFSKSNERAWETILRESYKSLKNAGIPLLVTDCPIGHHTSPAEVTRWRDFPHTNISLETHLEWRFTERQPDIGYAVNMEMEHFLAASGADDYLPTYRRFLDYERETHAPLSSPYNIHYAPAGNALYAGFIADRLEEVRPWAQKTP